ncbi:50S ribosomal protein L25 [Paenibacillus eucommiae]|uniref:Large ribosomal subunit protein bL25 n=1 Tax=Paenibacillus eucommiae TaxID=1355755 RepID=A0ABS4J8K2_9BACL|nr:50S ribosomal protein L25 [Paenibacillus eucommiae]MBP1996177.1 large subunit ribosomal protein L25 [Paenibacillus eucommiae]
MLTLKAEIRKENTASTIKQLRANGKVPAVVNGKKVGSTVIAIDQKELQALLRSNPNAIIEMELTDGVKHPVMIHEIQRGKVNRELLHIDFHQINMDEPVKSFVQIEFIGEAVGVSEGGILQIQQHELEIRCLPDQIPASIKVDVSDLKMGDHLLVSDLTLPSDVEIKTDPGELLVTILTPQKETAPDEPTEDSPEAAEAPAETV